MSFNKKFFATGGIVASSAECTTDTADKFGDGNGIALYNLDYDASDASGNYDGTPTNVTFGVGGNINYGARFNGSTSTIDIDATATTPIDFSSEVFSVSLWINPHSFSTENTFFAKYGTGGVSSTHRTIIMKTDTSGRFVVIENDGSSIYTQTSTATISANTYTFFAYTRSGSTSKIYINNNSAESQSRTNTIKNGSTQELTIGGLRSGVTDLDGDLDQVRIFSSTLTDAQVSTLYAEQACVHTGTTTENDYQGTTAAYYKFDNSAEDEKGNYDGTETDIEYRFGRYGQAAVFNGSSSKITTSYTTNDSAFTISGWIKHTSTTFTGKYHYLAGKGYYSSSSNTNYWQLVNYSSEFPEFRIRLNASSVAATSSVAMKLHQWHHLAASVDSSGNMKIYLDGVLTGSATGAPSRGMSQGINYGVYLDGTTFFHDGQIDQIRYYPSVLDADAIQNLYNEKPETDTSNFKAVLYEGTGATNYISNIGMDLETNGGLLWIKNRDATYNHVLYDHVRDSFLYSNQTYDEDANTTISFEKSGFQTTSTSGAQNIANDRYVAWVWKGGGDAVQNNDGTINGANCMVSANTDAGFSIVKYNGNSTAGATVGHGLGTPPDLIIVKLLDSSKDWYVFSELLGQSGGEYQYLELNDSPAANTFNTQQVWNGVLPTSDVFTLTGGSADNLNNNDYIAYCFHSVSGYSKIGTYEGDGTTSGNIVYTTDDGTSTGSNGFEPSFLLIKNIDTSGNSWHIFDSARNPSNPVNLFLKPNQNAIEGSSNSVNFEDNGFELLATYINTSSDTYLYMAFK